jgi:hypothetical protein
MSWKTFREINRSLFAPPKDFNGMTFYKLAALLVSVGSLIGAYYKAPDGVVHWLIENVVSYPAAKSADAIAVWDKGGHFGFHIVSALLLVGAVYAMSFAVVAQERLDFRQQQATALGLKFVSVRREHDILNLGGDCRTVSTEDFDVYGIYLSHLDRHFQLTKGDKWESTPVVAVESLPDGSSWNRVVEDSGALRKYILNFFPPLHQTQKTVRLRITDEIPGTFWMYRQDAPEHPVLGGQVESTSWFVVDPIEKLEISVTFPYSYRAGGQSQVSVRYKGTRTVHEDEQTRLRACSALKSEIENDRLTLRLTVSHPVVGLHYYLYWEPPKRDGEKKPTA